MKSLESGVDSLKDATVTVTVNGKSVGEVIRDGDAYESQQGRYYFYGEISPGDVVKIDVSGEGMNAWAEVTAPSAPTITGVDTSTVLKYDNVYEEMSDHWDIRAHLQDGKGETDYYRLKMEHSVSVTVSYDDEKMGHHKPDKDFDYTEDILYEPFSDPILTNGYAYSSSDNILSDLTPSNITRIFSDEMFRDTEGTVDMYFKKSLHSVHAEAYEAEVRGVTFKDNNSISVRFEHISKDTYNYLQVINIGEVMGYETSPIVEPAVIPSNVQGGLGFVGIASVSVFTVRGINPVIMYYNPDYYQEYD